MIFRLCLNQVANSMTESALANVATALSFQHLKASLSTPELTWTQSRTSELWTTLFAHSGGHFLGCGQETGFGQMRWKSASRQLSRQRLSKNLRQHCVKAVRPWLPNHRPAFFHRQSWTGKFFKELFIALPAMRHVQCQGQQREGVDDWWHQVNVIAQPREVSTATPVCCAQARMPINEEAWRVWKLDRPARATPVFMCTRLQLLWLCLTACWPRKNKTADGPRA